LVNISSGTRVITLAVVLALAALTGGCRPGESALEEADMVPSINVTSLAFREGATIPAKFTCDGEDVSPALTWSTPPAGTKSLALIVDDPDAPRSTFTHWVLFNIPASATGLSEGIAASPELPDGSKQGRTDFGQTGYGGPCPPPGRPHHYRFTLYALHIKLELSAGASVSHLTKAIDGHILARGRLTGVYQR